MYFFYISIIYYYIIFYFILFNSSPNPQSNSGQWHKRQSSSTLCLLITLLILNNTWLALHHWWIFSNCSKCWPFPRPIRTLVSSTKESHEMAKMSSQRPNFSIQASLMRLPLETMLTDSKCSSSLQKRTNSPNSLSWRKGSPPLKLIFSMPASRKRVKHFLDSSRPSLVLGKKKLVFAVWKQNLHL